MKFSTGAFYTLNLAHLCGRATTTLCLFSNHPDSQIRLGVLSVCLAECFNSRHGD